MSWLRRLAFQRPIWGVLLEAWGLAAVVLCLIFAVVHELPQTNIPTTYLFLVQIPVGWAALRLKLSSRPCRWRGIGRETAVALGLQGIALISAWLLARAFQAQDSLTWATTNPAMTLLALTSCFLPYLAYRLSIYLLLAWRNLAERRLLWMMVNTHLVTVCTIILLASALYRIRMFDESIPAYHPSGVVANLVLEFVRAVIPWAGVSIVFALATLAAFFLPALLTSYLTSRPLVRRIDELATAMSKVRQGDLSARVRPTGSDEVAQLQADFNQMAADLQQEREKVAALLKNQRELSAVVSHELRTPVTVMRAYIENDLFEATDSLPESYRKDLLILHHETLKLQSLVEDLFTLSQLDANRLELECRWVDGAGVVERVSDALRKVAWDNKRIELCAQLLPDLPEVWADGGRLEQVLGNLVQNAIRHTEPGGAILLQAAPVETWLEIRVIDSGEGIAPEDLPHVWERFYRGAGGHKSGRTGIGLSLVKEMVENMGGTVGVESQPAEGSRFWLRLKARPRPDRQ